MSVRRTMFFHGAWSFLPCHIHDRVLRAFLYFRADTVFRPQCFSIGSKSLSLWSSSISCSIATDAIMQSIGLRIAIPLRRRKRYMSAALMKVVRGIGRKMRLSNFSLTSSYSFCLRMPWRTSVSITPHIQISSLFRIKDSNAATWGGHLGGKEIDPHSGINNDHHIVRPLRKASKSPSQ